MADSLSDLNKTLKQFALDRDWEQYHDPKNLSMALIAEAAELVEHFQWLTPEQSTHLSKDKLSEVGYEMADILIYLVRMSERLDIDIIKAAQEKIEITRGSGNVFRDAGFPNPDVEQAKAILSAEIIKALDSRKLSVRKAQALTKVQAADFSRIRSADIRRFTIDRLIKILNKLDPEVDINMEVRHPKKRKRVQSALNA